MLRLYCYVNISAISASKWKFLMIIALLLFVAYPCHVAGINSRKSVAFESNIRAIRATPFNTDTSGLDVSRSRRLADPDPTSQPSGQPSNQPSTQPSCQPSNQPTGQPTRQPSHQPSGQPSGQPSNQPSAQPSGQPSNSPSNQPSQQPTMQPSNQPTIQPSGQPTAQPSDSPSSQPSGQPTNQPTSQPSGSPSSQPSAQPSNQPSSQPSRQPSNQPSSQPSGAPSAQPSHQPSGQPSARPSSQPSGQPTVQPSAQPSAQPSVQPSAQPSYQPTGQPSGQPSQQPSAQPTRQPSSQPSWQPSRQPSHQPSAQPSNQPSRQPSQQPSMQPSSQPSSKPSGPSSQPTNQPSNQPTSQPSLQPSLQPSTQPTARPSCQPSSQPSIQPSIQPSNSPTGQPTGQPSSQPSAQPSGQPSAQPSQQPTMQPTMQPSQQPSSQPTIQPTSLPTGQPSRMPTMQPSTQPSSRPTGQPSVQPSLQPSSQPSHQPSLQPSNQPTSWPSNQPTSQPSAQPSGQPSSQPSLQPTVQPSWQPSTQPSTQPSLQPSSQPSKQPSAQPLCQPSWQPSSQPTVQPSAQPSSQPSRQPTDQPSAQPSAQPSVQPTGIPTAQPSGLPSMQPSSQPSALPTGQPSAQPSSSPTVQPSMQPTSSPSAQPSGLPTTQPSMQPSGQPSTQPSIQPSHQPSVQPTSLPTGQPSSIPSSQPSRQPTMVPSGQPSAQPSNVPSSQPSEQPTLQPSVQPTTQPSSQPTAQPSRKPSAQPSTQPSSQPSSQPSMQPTIQPSTQPSTQPSVQPSTQPSMQPTAQPSVQPSVQPSGQPSAQPSVQPSCQPSLQPTVQPSNQPTSQPSIQPSSLPSTQPSSVPSMQPSAQPSSKPSGQPTGVPSMQPSRQPSAQPSMQPSTQPSSQPTNPTAQPSASPSTQPSSQPSFLLKVLRVELTMSSVFVEDSVLDGITVAWNELPSQAIQLAISFDPVNTSSVGDFSLPYVYPSTFTLLSTSSGVGSQSFAVIGGTHVGLHRLKLVLSGASIREFRTSSEGFESIRIVARGGFAPAPLLLSAVFSFDGTSVAVTFDTPTNRGGYGTVFPCAALLVFPGASTARCLWTDNARIAIFPLYTSQSIAVLDVGGTITVVDNTIRALCDLIVNTVAECAVFAPVSNTTMLQVLAPGTPTKPTVALVVPSTVGACASLSVDISASAGAAGRPWLRGAFEVSASGASEAAYALQSYLNANYTTNRGILVPSTVLQRGVNYTIQIVMCNFLESCDFAAKTVSVSASSAVLPVVSVLGASPLSVFRTTTLTLSSNSYVQSCDGSVSRANLRYAWTIRRRSAPTGAFDTVVAAPSVSQDPTVYKLSSFTLMPGTSYQMILTVTSRLTGTSASDSVIVNVLASRLVARIASGLKQTVTVGTRISLDGSSSTDPDVAVSGGINSGLLYQWTCSQRHPQFNPNCTVLLSNTVNAVMAVNATQDSINTTSRVTLTVFDASRSRSATTYTDIVIVTGTSNPVLRVSSPLSSLASVNTARTLALLGTVQTSVGCNAAWSADDNSIMLSKVALTTVSSRIPASPTPVPINLVLSAGVLPVGATFVFTLSCGNAATSIEVTTNSPPLPGEFAVAPMSGTELVTLFQFNALLWSDTDLPVTYQFGFAVASSANALIVSPRSLLSYASTTLPAGGSNSGSASGVNCTLQVFDSLNAVSISSKVVSVFSAAVVGNIQLARQQQVLALVTASTTMPASDGTTASVTNLISIASAVMNDINSTAAPNCTGLSRSPCTRIENTCGACLKGYIGDTGFKNTPCKLISSSVPVSNATIVGECNSDIHCRSYQYCEIATHTCVSPLKSCNSNCSKQGSCIYLSTITGLPLNTRCGVDNTKCEAVCSCTAGYSGLACEMDTSTLFVRRAVRSQLINSLQNLTLAQDVNAETLSLWSSSLLSLALNPYELSVQDAVVASAIANKTLMYALSQGLDAYDDFVSVLQVTDTLASLQRYNYNPHDYMRLNDTTSTYFGPNSAINIVQVTSAFGELVVNNMQLGQERVTYYYDNFRLDLHKQELPGADLMYDPTMAPTAALTLLGSNTTLNNTDDAPQQMVYMPNITIMGPQTEFEILLGEPQTSAFVQPGLSASTTVGIKTLSVYPRAYTANTSNFLSTPLFIQMSGLDSSGNVLSDSSDYISTIDFAFPFNAEVPVFAQYPTVLNVTSNCTAERGPGRPGGYKIVEHYHTCPGSNAVILHNCTGILGTLVSYCPVLAPTCAHLSVSSAFITPLSKCTVAEYNSTYTTCRCIVNATDISTTENRQGLGVSATRAMVSRRLQNADQEVISADGTSNMVATASYISANRDDEFSPAFIVILPESNPKVYIVVYTLASLWGAALIVFCVFFYLHKKQSSKVKSMEVVKSNDACIESGSRMENAKSLITEYVIAVIPLSLQQNLPAWKIMLAELSRHHRYFVLFSTKHRAASVYVRSAMLARILTYTTWMMFLLAILYHYQSPQDDNKCDTYDTQSACVHEKRMFDPAQSVCSWNYHAHLFMHTCDYKEKYTLPTGFIYMLTLTAIGVALLSNVIDAVFDVLQAPLTSDQNTDTKNASLSLEHGNNNSDEGGQVLPLTPRQSTQYVRKTSAGHGSSWTRSVSPAPSPTALHAPPRSNTAMHGGDCFEASDELLELHERTGATLTGLLHNADVLRDYLGERSAAPTSPTHRARGATNRTDNNFNDARSSPHPFDSAVEISAASPVQQLSLRIPGSPARSPTNSPVGSAKRSRVVPAATQSDATLQDLMERVLAQRRLLPEDSEELRQFDAQWCIFIASEAGSNSPQSFQPKYSLSESAQSKLLNQMQSSDQQASQMRAQLVSASPLQAGVVLLQTFVLDLLGHTTTVGKIVRNRFQIDCGLHAAVSAELKLFCALLVLAVNAAMVYYIFYISYQRQQMWQWCYLVAVGVQVLFDMCISETLQCIMHHYTLPSLVRNEMGRVVTVLHRLIHLVSSPHLPHDPRSAFESTNTNLSDCNVTPFLFVSNKLARTRPLLLESALILSYATANPGLWKTEDEFPAETKLLSEYLVEWGNEWYMQPQQYAGYFVLSCGVQTVRFLRHIGTLPESVQLAIIRCLQVILVCALILFALAASKSLAALIILVVSAALFGSALLWRHYYVRAREPSSDNIKVVPVDGERVSSGDDKSLPNQSFEPDGAFVVDQHEEQKAGALESDLQESELDEIPAVDAVLPFADDLVEENDVKQFVEGESEAGEETQETIWNFRSFWEGADDENVLSTGENNDDVELFEPLEEDPVVVQVGIKPTTRRVIGELVSSAVSEAVYQEDLLAVNAPAETVFDSRLQETINELVSDAVKDATTHIEGIVPAAPEDEPQQPSLGLEQTAGELAEQAMLSAAAHVEGLIQAAPFKSAGDVDESAALINQTAHAKETAKIRDPISNPARVAMQKAIANYSVKQPTHIQEVLSAETKISSRAELEPVAVPITSSAVAGSVLATQHVPVALQEYLSSPKVNPVERDTKLALAEYFGMMWSENSVMSPLAAGVEPDRVDQTSVDAVTRRRDTLSLDLQNSAPTVSAKEGFAGALSPSGVVATFPAGDLASDTSAPMGETVVPAPGMLSVEAAQQLQNTVRRQAEELAEANRVKMALEARLDETRQLLQMFAAGREVQLGTALSPGTSSPAVAFKSGQETAESDITEVQHPEVTQLNANNAEPERADTPTKSPKPAKSTYAAVDVPLEADLALQLPVFSRNFAKPSSVSRSQEEYEENPRDHMIVPIVTAANAQISKDEVYDQKDAAAEDTTEEGSSLPNEEAVTVAEARVESSQLAASLVHESILGASEKVAEIVSDSVKHRRKSNAARAAKAAVGDIMQQGSSKVATARHSEAKVKSEKANRKASMRKTDSTAPRVRQSQVVDAASSTVESVLAQGSSKVLTAMAASASTTTRTRKSTIRKNDKERQRAERAAAQTALIDSYEVTSSIFSSDGEGSGSSSGSNSRSRSSSGSSSSGSSGSYSGSNSGSYSRSYSGSSASGDYKSHSRDEGRSSKKYGHFNARNVDTYDPTSSIFSSDEEEEL